MWEDGGGACVRACVCVCVLKGRQGGEGMGVCMTAGVLWMEQVEPDSVSSGGSG